MPSSRPACMQGGEAPAGPPKDTSVRVGALALGIMSRLIQVVRMLHQVGGPEGLGAVCMGARLAAATCAVMRRKQAAVDMQGPYIAPRSQ